MGGGAATYYSTPVASQPVNTGFSLALPNNIGNPNLAPEIADTWTAGFVLKSPFESPLINKMQLSIDWYSIELTGLITAEAQDNVYQNCLDITRNTTSDPTAPACLQIIRDQVNGAVQTVNTSFVNAGGFKTTGIDAELDWASDLADIPFLTTLPGTMTINVLANYTDELSVQPNAGGASTDFVGTVGPNTGGLNAPAFEYRTTTNFGYSVGPTSVSLRWRHLPSLDPLPGSGPTLHGPAAHDEFDLSANYSISDHFALRGGIDNLLDEQPEITASNSAVGTPAYSTGSGVTLPAIYDVLGRRFYLGLTMKY
jgi:outer membrane receptor protein involved in Fe transport